MAAVLKQNMSQLYSNCVVELESSTCSYKILPFYIILSKFHPAPTLTIMVTSSVIQYFDGDILKYTQGA
jgi:hypothetical protein